MKLKITKKGIKIDLNLYNVYNLIYYKTDKKLVQ